jgi:predicted nucleotide-binding protein (sugar kinase/HSP70/actin superfamily)
MQELQDSLGRCRNRFQQIPAQRDRPRPLIGVVGEIFCRLNTFSNEDLVRRLEAQGAEAWVSDLAEFVWYMNAEQMRWLRLRGRVLSREALGAWVRRRVQRRDEQALLEAFEQAFAGREEPHVEELLEYARPYLPPEGAMGEMVLSVGKIVFLARQGAAGIVDISPFTCMNGIVCEAIYPRLSRDLGGIPIRNFYFDGTPSEPDADLGVFLELVEFYRRRARQAQPALAQRG